MLSDGEALVVRWDEEKAPECAIAVSINRATKQAQITMLYKSHPIPMGTLTLSADEFLAHIVGCVNAYRMIEGPGVKKLILPHMIGGKPIIP